MITVAARLLQEEGPAAVTTRGVAVAAGVRAPAVYRFFGDKDGLLEAVAEHVMATYVTAKAAMVQAASVEDVDPLDELRAGWEMQMDFGLANPALFRLLTDPVRMQHSPAAQSGRRVLERRVNRLAVAGRLCVSEQRAVDLISAAGTGAVITILSRPPEHRDPGLTDAIFAAVLSQILADGTDPADSTPVATVVALRAIAPRLDMLSNGEQHLLKEWLERAIGALQ